MANCTICQNPALNLCSLCKGSDGRGVYCSKQCQVADWPTHKATCSGRPKTAKKPKAKAPIKAPPFVISEADKEDAKTLPLMYYHPTQSPFGCSLYPEDMIPFTLSTKAKSWTTHPASLYTKVYRELADAFKYHITYDIHRFPSSDETRSEIGTSMPIERAFPAFKVFLRRYGALNRLPPWWTQENTTELLKLAEQGDKIKLDEPFDITPYEYEYTTRGILTRLGTIAEAACHVPVEIEQSEGGSIRFLPPAHLDPEAAAEWMQQPASFVQF